MIGGGHTDVVKLRLCTPRAGNNPESAVNLVGRYLTEILAARDEAKPWDAIGSDLQPDNPMKGDTVRKTVQRLIRKQPTQRLKPSKPKSRSVVKSAEALPQLLFEQPPAELKPRDLFARRIDTIRTRG